MLRNYLFSSDIFLLDEPFASLDAITKRKIHTWLIGVFEQLRLTVLFIIQDVDEALYLCDSVYMLSDCPSSVRIELSVPNPRRGYGHTITDPDYCRVRDSILDTMAI